MTGICFLRMYCIVLLFSTIPVLANDQQLAIEEHFNKGTQFLRQEQFDQALAEYKKVIDLNPHCYQVYYNCGLIYAHQKNSKEAMAHLKRAIHYNPHCAKAMVKLGELYLEQDQYDPAFIQLKKAYELEPQSLECCLLLAKVYVAQRNYDLAITFFKVVLKARPDDPTVLLDLGNALNMNNEADEALTIYRQLFSRYQTSSILYNIAYTLKKLGRMEEALPVYDQVISMDPEYPDAHFGRALSYLACGDFERGWPAYEWRWKRQESGERVFSKPVWDGSSLQGKRLFLHAEQGLGDTFQFIRYAQLAKAQGATVIVAVQSPLVQLLKLCPYLDKVIALGSYIPLFDVHLPLLSMPYKCKTTLQTIPVQIPYLYADPTLVRQWKDKLSSDPHFKVGLCWQGNDKYSTLFLRNAVAAKSIALAAYMPLFSVPHVSFYNLQKTSGEEQLNLMPEIANFHSFDGTFDAVNGRFMDTAAVMKNLDLVITVDTSITHLAGGLGVPVWMILPDPADWRWMLKRTDTPWYPSMRLFRQSKAGDWESVIAQLVTELQLVSKKS